jgi:phage terminase large subunit-like protein
MKITNDMLNSIPFQYAQDVRDGKIVVGKTIKQAVSRFYKWIDESDQSGFYIDHAAGMHIILFFEDFLIHTMGEKAENREPFILEPWQQFTLYNILGWKDQFGNRRIKTVYEKVARKNGKTATLAGVGLYFLCFDDESSPRIYAGATKEDQAKIVWQQAYDFVKKSIKLRVGGLKNTQREIRYEDVMGKFKFHGSNSETQDGLNPSLAIIDEYHAHKDDTIREVLESAMGARKNPLLYIITTAGFNMQSSCKQAEDIYKEILSSIKDDDHTFIMIHDLDDNDNWEDETNWIKANPNIDVSVYLEFLRSEFKKAINQPSKIPNFKTKHLNMWVDAADVRIPESIWDKCSGKIKMKNFIEHGCAGALDLSSTIDLSAIVFVSNPDEDGIRDLLPMLFCPLDTVEKRSSEDRVPYKFWKNQTLKKYIDLKGFKDVSSFFEKQPILQATPGNQIDYENLQSIVAFCWDVLHPKWYEYDSWQATQLVQNLTAREIEMHPFPQTTAHFSFPTKEFETLIYSEKIRHGGHPILKWMISGCVAYQDPNENIRYAKNKSTKRIDGIIASVMALAGTMTPEDNNESQYNNTDPNEITF